MADQEAARKLIEEWRAHALTNDQMSEQAYLAGNASKGERWAGRASVYRICADGLEAVLASPGSVSDQGWRETVSLDLEMRPPYMDNINDLLDALIITLGIVTDIAKNPRSVSRDDCLAITKFADALKTRAITQSQAFKRHDEELRQIVGEIRDEATTCRAHAMIPCQTEETWHADTFTGWADRIESAIALPAPAVSPAQPKEGK